MAVLHAMKNHNPDSDLLILSDSKYTIDGLTKHVIRWENQNWINTHHGDLFKCILAWSQWKKGKTTLKWVKGHSGIEGNEEADKLAREGAGKPPTTPISLQFPLAPIPKGTCLADLEQKDFYKIINGKKNILPRTRANQNVGRIQACIQESFNYSPSKEAIWLASKHKDFTKKMQDFLWKSTQNVYKIGEYWNPIKGYENRGTCPICNVQETMDHILTKCDATPRKTTWTLTNDLWVKKHNSPLPMRLGDILGCDLAKFKKNGKPNKGKNRLYRILTSETTYLIWRMRNERRIHDEDTTPNNSPTPTINRWMHAINKRLMINRALTDDIRFCKKAIDKKLVKATWRNCLDNEDRLPDNWTRLSGVLVGISPPDLSRPDG